MRDTDEKVLGIIRAAWAERGFAPTVREITDKTGYRSLSTIQRAIERLVGAGVLTRGERGSCRTLRPVGDA